MKIVLLGGNGFIGSNRNEALIVRGHSVRVFDWTGQPCLCSGKVAEKIE